MSKYSSFTSLALLALLSAGCASYAVPGRAADLSVFTRGGELDPVRETDSRPAADLSLDQLLARRPMAAFPTGIAVARVQEPGYESEALVQTAGKGAYTVIVSRDEGEEEALGGLGALPQVVGIAPVNRLLVPDKLRSDVELRKIAAQLHADVLLVYTVDTIFETDEHVLLTLITLGAARSQETTLSSTASALLIDTRTGYLYGTAEATARATPSHTAWGSSGKIEETRIATEEKAIAKLVAELERTWSGVVGNYSTDVRPTQ